VVGSLVGLSPLCQHKSAGKTSKWGGASQKEAEARLKAFCWKTKAARSTGWLFGREKRWTTRRSTRTWCLELNEKVLLETNDLLITQPEEVKESPVEREEPSDPGLEKPEEAVKPVTEEIETDDAICIDAEEFTEEELNPSVRQSLNRLFRCFAHATYRRSISSRNLNIDKILFI
jgi:hypothetical protein